MLLLIHLHFKNDNKGNTNWNTGLFKNYLLFFIVEYFLKNMIFQYFKCFSLASSQLLSCEIFGFFSSSTHQQFAPHRRVSSSPRRVHIDALPGFRLSGADISLDTWWRAIHFCISSEPPRPRWWTDPSGVQRTAARYWRVHLRRR